jgi:hypothetical protein
MKHPSNNPIASEIARSTKKDLVIGTSIVRIPILKNDIWKKHRYLLSIV